MNEIYGKAPLNNSAKWGRGGALAIGTMTSQSTPQPITGPLLVRAPGLQPRLAQWLMRPWLQVIWCDMMVVRLWFSINWILLITDLSIPADTVIAASQIQIQLNFLLKPKTGVTFLSGIPHMKLRNFRWFSPPDLPVMYTYSSIYRSRWNSKGMSF